MEEQTFYVLILFGFGIIVGSFLNVCISRIPHNNSIVHGFSYCPSCEMRISPIDLIPIVSYVILKGKCRFCREKISLRYPLVEVLTGVLFILTYFEYGLTLFLFKYLFIFCVLVVISFIDIDHKIIPNKLVLALFVWVLAWQLLWSEISFLEAGIGSLIGGGFLLLAAIISRGGMGGGDIKLMFVAGFFLGISLTGLAIFLATLVGGIIGLILMALKLKGRKDTIPFGPFLSGGIVIASLWGEEMIRVYLELL